MSSLRGSNLTQKWVLKSPKRDYKLLKKPFWYSCVPWLVELDSKTGSDSLCGGFVCCKGFHACPIPYVEDVCGPAWWHLRDPLATRAGRRNRAWGRKSQSKSRLGRFHDTPSVPLAYNFQHNLGTRSHCYVFPFATSDCSGWQGGQKGTKSERLSDKKPRYFCDAASQLQSGQWQLSHRREKPYFATFCNFVKFGKKKAFLIKTGRKSRIQKSRILNNSPDLDNIWRSISLLKNSKDDFHQTPCFFQVQAEPSSIVEKASLAELVFALLGCLLGWGSNGTKTEFWAPARDTLSLHANDPQTPLARPLWSGREWWGLIFLN